MTRRRLTTDPGELIRLTDAEPTSPPVNVSFRAEALDKQMDASREWLSLSPAAVALYFLGQVEAVVQPWFSDEDLDAQFPQLAGVVLDVADELVAAGIWTRGVGGFVADIGAADAAWLAACDDGASPPVLRIDGCAT